ncbi:type IV secretion system DNA-binding domain-containing protein [Mucilaginibacter sp. KACC 22063]|uniref:type IV secretion system DNA-binding domain-containing protein n=1 Tax=Mucilaginibacter sp. KACC 22063 TaxID=3025666 RepID=UPI0023668263|nr:type IV secretion system DNA-binding domain-containing protein [Mucilaginibacter sp. KACC 22063]WDF55895.1 type IV secretion system DNA-binding domain-containing protein [Mucilaginibacter sp. KACC 22063]
MEETREQQKLHGFLQCLIYVMVAIEAAIFVYIRAPFWGIFHHALYRISLLPFYANLIYSKLVVLGLICLVSIGTVAKKEVDLEPKKHIVYPLTLGLMLFFGSLFCYGRDSPLLFAYTRSTDLAYMLLSVAGALLTSIAMDNISKLIRSGLGKDVWNVEGESFQQPEKLVTTDYSVNIPMLFYYKRKVRNGWINLTNPFRATLLIGTPGSGKSFSIVNPFIRQLTAKGFCLALYDFKFPDLGQIAYYHYLLAKQQGKLAGYDFHVVNLNEVEKSRRINPWKKEYIRTLADAGETAEALVEAMKKGDKSGGSDQFFTQSAINFLSACIYFQSRYEDGKYSSFPHVLALLNRSYEEIFQTLFKQTELASLLSPFVSAFKNKAFDQLEGQVGTLKIFLSRLATKETYWVFSGDDFDLKISDKSHPAMLVLANDPATQNINSACYSVIINRLTKLINSKGNKPSALIIDELPTLFVHKIENLIATARSNKVAVLMGLQELPQFQQQYGKDTAATITSVTGNVLSGAVRSKETLDWLEKLLGRNKQISEGLSIDRNKTSTSLNEKLETLVPAGKIATLNAGELVGVIATDAKEAYTGQYESSAINCKVNLNLDQLKKEESGYKSLPVYYDFGDAKEAVLTENFKRINREIAAIVQKHQPPKVDTPKASMKEQVKNNRK